ncbi:MAG: gamma-glutamyltransferase family protein [Planctomycetes bacterium]|nr:gamma-glutamyltransferase family protein [Planctomycetota bacterium]
MWQIRFFSLVHECETRKLSDVAKHAIKLGRDGFPVSKGFAAAMKTYRERLAKDPGCAKMFLKNGEPFAEGAIYRNPAFASLLEKFAERESFATFYKGDVADKIAAAFKENNGIVTAGDLAAYRAIEVEPLSLKWNGFTLYTPPPSSGGLTVLQTLSILKALGWPAAQANETVVTRTFVEALRIAWTDRFQFLGDPQKIKVPIARLLSEEHAKTSAERVREALKSGKPVEAKSDGRSANGTVDLNAIDSSGLTAALTFTHGGYLGAQVAIEELGIVFGHGMSRFDPRPGRANSPGPGKRPLHNMCPTIVTKDGQSVLSVGATGGRKIVSAVTAVLANRIGHGMAITDTVNKPRIHSEGDLATIVDNDIKGVEALKDLGYTVTTGTVAALNAIERNPETGTLASAAR